eukprot:2378686-Pyramimonas_sp.AAC.1
MAPLPCWTKWVRAVALYTTTLIFPRNSGPTTPKVLSMPLGARHERAATRAHVHGGASAAMPAGTSSRPQVGILASELAHRS